MKVKVKKNGKIVIPVEQGDILYIEEDKNSAFIIFPKKSTPKISVISANFLLLKVVFSLCLLLLIGFFLTKIITNTNIFENISYAGLKVFDFIVNITTFCGTFLVKIITNIFAFEIVLYIGLIIVIFPIMIIFGAITDAIFKILTKIIGHLIQYIVKFIQLINWKIVGLTFILIISFLGGFFIGGGFYYIQSIKLEKLLTTVFVQQFSNSIVLGILLVIVVFVLGRLISTKILAIFEIIKRFTKEAIGFLIQYIWKLIFIVFISVILIFYYFYFTPKPYHPGIIRDDYPTRSIAMPLIGVKIEQIEQILGGKLTEEEKKTLLDGKPVFSKREDKQVCIKADVETANTCVVQIMPDYHWIYKTEKISSKDIASTTKNIVDETEKFKNRLSKTDMQTLFDMATDVISVGVASQKGNSIQEKKRADRRAEKLAGLIEESIEISPLPDLHIPDLHILNLGKYRLTSEMDKEKTIDQRRIIIIGIKKNNTELKILLDKCIRQCWDNNKSIYAVKPSDYLEKLPLRPYERKKID
jgi:hypothetical protein